MYVTIIGYVVTVVSQRRGLKRKKPYSGYSKFIQVIKFFSEPLKITDTVRVTVMKRFYIQFVNNGIFIAQKSVCKIVFFLNIVKILLFFCKVNGSYRKRNYYSFFVVSDFKPFDEFVG